MRLSVQDVASIFRVPEKTVYRWVKQDGLPASQINDQYRFNRAQVLEWATAQNIAPEGALFADGEATAPSLVNAIEAGGICHDVPGDDKTAVMRAVVQRMALPPNTDREFLLQILLARESMGSTGIGDGIAIPHVRNPIVLDVPVAVISLCFLAKPIDFAAVDGKPVDTLFTLITPTVRVHLTMLSRLAFMLRDGELKAALRRRATPDEILEQMRRLEATLPGAK